MLLFQTCSHHMCSPTLQMILFEFSRNALMDMRILCIEQHISDLVNPQQYMQLLNHFNVVGPMGWVVLISS